MLHVTTYVIQGASKAEKPRIPIQAVVRIRITKLLILKEKHKLKTGEMQILSTPKKPCLSDRAHEQHRPQP